MNCNYCELSPSLETQLSLWLQLPCTNAAAEQQRPGCQSILWEMPKERQQKRKLQEELQEGFVLCQWCLPGVWGSACAQGLLAVVELLPGGGCVAECWTDPQHRKPQAVGFIRAVAVPISQERINTADSAAEQLQWTGTPLSSGQAVVPEPGTAWFAPPAFLNCTSESAGSLLA